MLDINLKQFKEAADKALTSGKYKQTCSYLKIELADRELCHCAMGAILEELGVESEPRMGSATGQWGFKTEGGKFCFGNPKKLFPVDARHVIGDILDLNDNGASFARVNKFIQGLDDDAWGQDD